MGLAASQCRLLFITQRQNDVSAKMQRISMDRLSLARDEDDIETKYNRMLNATKFEVKDGVSLSYDSLMNVSNAEMYVITDSYGRVVLNSSKASLYGIPSNKPQGNSGEFSQIAANSTETKFISRLMNLPENDVAQILADGSVKWENSPEYQTFLQTNGTCPEKGN